MHISDVQMKFSRFYSGFFIAFIFLNTTSKRRVKISWG